MTPPRPVVDLTVLLTVYKRKNLRDQIKAVLGQSVVPKEIVVFQNGLHQRLPALSLRAKKISYVLNSSNTGYFGRFSYLLNAKTEHVAVLDDDIIPGRYCLENYLTQTQESGALIGGNGRIARNNPEVDVLDQPSDVGVRNSAVLVDFIGHMWVFRRELLHDMFAIPPVTAATGEDMHLCFSSKLRSGVPSFVARQSSLDESCDVRLNKLASDSVASFRATPKSEREKVETYFSELGLNFISRREQLAAQAHQDQN